MPPRARRTGRSEPAAAIPDKAFFKIGEVARLCGIATSALRFWETEFKTLRPEKTKSGQRVYKRRHVEQALEIRRLLYDEGFTIEGARARLRGESAAEPTQGGPSSEERTRLVAGLREILAMLDE